jgi:hypothetical protein
MSPTKKDGTGLTNAEQKIVREFEVAAYTKDRCEILTDPRRPAILSNYRRARAKLVALIRQNRPK